MMNVCAGAHEMRELDLSEVLGDLWGPLAGAQLSGLSLPWRTIS
jgi:hypothetical protein